MKQNLKPLRDRLIVKILQAPPASQLIITREKEPEFLTGEVMAVGKDVAELQVGDRIGFSHFNGSDLPSMTEPAVPDTAEAPGTPEVKYRTLIESDVAFVIDGNTQVE